MFLSPAYQSFLIVRHLSNVVKDTRNVKKCRRYFDLRSRFFGIKFIWVLGHSNIPANYKADELARAGALHPKSSLTNSEMTAGHSAEDFIVVKLSQVYEE